jgi:glutamate-ammonia-ligase adenylyltransferase
VVSLPELESYSESEWAAAELWSPAVQRYRQRLNDLALDSLHGVRHRAWLKCVLATYFQRATAEAVCAAWSTTADQLLLRVWYECGLAAREAALFALGKHGARELNLSSDIDLLVVSDEFDLLQVERALRRFQQILHTPGEFGFCFRLDFDLRPGGQMGPLVVTPAQFQDHYWSQGETWERLALVRLRPVVGSARLRQQTMDLAKRFSYRRFLDFTLLEDLKALRSKVHRTGFQRRAAQLHLKLEVGGIRDIELFVHSLLVLNGGKLTDLQTVSTSEALRRLKAKKLLSAAEADRLLETYWWYRQLENLVQSVDDRQTHSLSEPTPSLPGISPIAEVQARMQEVDQIVSGLLGQVDLEQVNLPAQIQQKEWLESLGFSTQAIASVWDPLMKATALSHKNDRDERARQEFLYTFVMELSRNSALDRDLGLNLLLDFVRATRAKATFFTMLLRSPRLIQDLARLFCLSPYLGSIIASRPELLDHFILQLDEDWSPESEALAQQMSERKRLTELWSANQFLSDRDLSAMFERITQTADAITSELLRILKLQFPGAQLEILKLGKWAGRELGLRSDLDFIFITPGTPNELDFKVARRLISRLTDPSNSGSLYDLDLRLRPSGQSGPLLVAVDKLVEYWQTTAAAWERQAYLRAQPLGAAVTLAKHWLVEKPLGEAEQAELKRIRSKLLRAVSEESLDIKYAPGGLLEIEFAVQTAILQLQLASSATSTLGMIDELAQKQAVWRRHASELKACYLQLREFEQMLQLSSLHATSEAKRHSESFAKAERLLGFAAGSAWLWLNERLKSSSEMLRGLEL